MADNHAKDVSIAGLVALLAFIALKNGEAPPLEAPHVGVEKAGAAPSPTNLQRFHAQLAQDPFAALPAAAKTSSSGENTPAREDLWTPIDDVKQWVESQKADQCTVLLAGVLADTNPNPDRAETRRRRRVALQEGMQAQKVGRIDPLHLGGLRYPVPGSQAGVERTIDVPFELFERERLGEQQKCLAVLMLWLDNQYFLPMSRHDASQSGAAAAVGPSAAAEIRGLMDALAKPDPRQPDSIRRVLFGPENSDQLRQVLRRSKVNVRRAGDSQEAAPPITIYSYASTASLESLLDTPTAEHGGGDALLDLIQRQQVGGFKLVRTIRDDAQIWRELWDEIERRRAATGDRPGRVVVVSSFGQLYAEKLSRMLEQGERTRHWMPVRAYRFMSELNGSRAHAPDAGDASHDRAGGEGKPRDGKDPRNRVHSEGNEQFDYVDRLAQTIASDLGDTGDQFVAVGVFGGDAHDKITLIRALRNRLDRAQYFTTDLDMRLLDPEHIKYTRNTLAGSAYGLMLDPRLQAGFAPFRDAYQTSLFFAAQVAVGRETNSLYAWDGRRSDKTACLADERALGACAAWTEQDLRGIYGLAPAGQRSHVFEIGLSRFVPMPAAGDHRDTGGTDLVPASDGADPGPLWTDYRTLSARLGVAVGVFGLAVLTVFGLSKLVVGDLKHWVPRPRHFWRNCLQGRQDRMACWVFVVLVLALILRLAYLTAAAARETLGSGIGEPGELLQGVSIWGCVFIRWVGILLALWYLVLFLEIYLQDKQQSASGGEHSGRKTRSWKHLPIRTAFVAVVERIHDIRAEPRKPAAPEARAPASPGRLKALLRSPSLRRVLWNALWPRLHHRLERPVNGDAIWSAYARRTALREVLAAALIHVTAISLLMEALLAVGGQPADFTRTEHSNGLYFLSGRAAAWLLFLLLYITTYVFRLCRDWMDLQALTEEDAARIRWDATARRDVLDAYGLGDFASGPGLAQVADLLVTLGKIGRHTDSICRFVYAPFVVLAILLLSTWQRFEYFQWPLSAQLLLAFVTLWGVYNAFILERAASRAKRNILAVLNRRIVVAQGEDPGGASFKDRLAALQQDATERSDGAFKPLLEQPYVRALLLPAGATTLLSLLDLFNKF